MTVAENICSILKDIEGYRPTIIAVTKYFGVEKMIEAFNAGLRDFAESKAIESLEKINKMDDTAKAQSRYHFIGHLQTNKVKYVVGNFDYIHSVDSLKLAQCINKKADETGIVQKILLQVNNAKEEQKFGISVENLALLLDEVSKLKSVSVEGLMSMAPIDADNEELHRLFSQMKELKDKFGLRELSMGMSRDYKIAAQNGATMIRIGKKLFE